MLRTSILSDRQDVLVAAGLAIVVLVAGCWYMVLGVSGNFQDDAIYVSTAKALAQGEGYRLINLPNSPVQTKYPFLYPALLAIIWKLWPSFPENLLAMQGLSLLMGAATVALSYMYMLRFGYCTRGVALASGLLCAASSGFLFFCTQTLSEMPFALLLVVSLWAFDRQIRAPSESRSFQFLLGFLIALPFLCRTIGAILPIVGLIIICCLGRPVFWVALGSLTGMLPWVVWVLIHLGGGGHDTVTIYYTDYLGWWSLFGLSSIIRIFFFNIVMVGISITMLSLGVMLSFLTPTFWTVFGNLLCSTTLVTVLKQLRQGQLLPWCLIGYLFVTCLWPWSPFRFLVPILPLLLAYLLRAIWVMLQGLSFPPRHRYLLAVGLTVLVTANLVLVYRGGQVRHDTSYPYDRLQDPPVCWSSYKGIFEWLAKHCQPDDVIASGLDSMVYLYTGCRAFRPYIADPMSMFYGLDRPTTGTEQDLIQILKAGKPRYLVHTPVPGVIEAKPFTKVLNRLLVNQPGWLQPVYVGDDQRFVVYELQSQMEPAAQQT
jgi:hypothetical protein